jgi:hypothetical protein
MAVLEPGRTSQWQECRWYVSSFSGEIEASINELNSPDTSLVVGSQQLDNP